LNQAPFDLKLVVVFRKGNPPICSLLGGLSEDD